MSKIKILSPQEICKIAAGEVVERPANIVKELVENALDAGANNIEVYISKAGKAEIRVLDDGCGMSHSDALLCFAHHATSKIQSVADLDDLSSFGFRGEALSSISAVSKVTLVTMEKASSCATQVMLEGGRVVSQIDIASAVGTDILITDLFYNVPARQKFLKKDDTEWRQILLLMQAFIFNYINVHFKLYHDGRLVYNCPPVKNLSERVLQLWDNDTAGNMLTIDHDDGSGIKLKAVASSHQIFRYNRASIYCFVNRRLVKNHGLVKAILKGYAGVLPEGRYPLAVLFIDMPNLQVDINVHPRKEEVSFLNPRKIENLVTLAVKQALEKQLSSYVASPKLHNQPVGYSGHQGSTFKAGRFDKYENRYAKFDYIQEPKVVVTREQLIPILSSEMQNSFVERNYEIIGQFKKTYIVVSNEDGMRLVDQHAAHERIMYERFRENFAEVVSVSLMFPVIITLSQQDLDILKPHMYILQQHGIGADIFGTDQIIIQSIPTYLKQSKLDELIYQLIAWLQEYQALDLAQFTKKINEQLQAQMACKAAVKAGDILSKEQMYELLDDLEKVDNRLTCPHGRPTIWNFSLSEIEKKFKRKV